MKKDLLLKLGGIAATVSLLGGATFAFFTTNSVTLSGTEITTANPGLEIFTTDSGWTTTTANAGVLDSNITPGWTGPEHLFSVRNTTGGGVALTGVVAKLTSGTPDWDALKDVVKLSFRESGGAWSTPQTLNWWNTTGQNILNSTLDDGTQRDLGFQFSMDSSADDGAKGKTLNIELTMVGQTL